MKARTFDDPERDNAMMSARSVATETLRRVQNDSAWASRVLDMEIDRAGLDARDAAFATGIVYGTLRCLVSIDKLIDTHADKTDPIVRSILRCAVFEILYLDRVPIRAAVHEAVDLAHEARGPRVAGFVNAVLRKIERPDPVTEPTLELPKWIRDRLRKSVGAERAASYRGAKAPLDLRLYVDRDAWLATLAEHRPDVQAEPFGLHGVRLDGGGDPRIFPGFDEGAFVVQEAGSQRISECVGAFPGQRIADCCAGRGGKTVALADAIGPGGHITAIELHESRVEQIAPAFARLGLQTSLSAETIDLSVGNGGLEPNFDHVLVDAPCSGLGTVHRRPEILLRLRAEDLPALVDLQRAITRNAASLVKPGGTLTYAVCSFAKDEGVSAMAPLEEELRAAGFEGQPLEGGDDDGWLRLGPWCQTDGYQVRQWKRRRALA